MARTPPAAPQPAAATMKTSSRAMPTRTPEDRAARSSSRIAVSTRPTRDRSRKYTPPMASTATISAAQ